DGLELSLGSRERSIQYLGPSEKMLLQIYVRGISMGDELVSIMVKHSKSTIELVKTALVRVG
ncbi:MAG: hypothetical protein ACFFEF_17090, partial [Candidatus Thorarchaeota archaeon]